jgi:hypothetical protein
MTMHAQARLMKLAELDAEAKSTVLVQGVTVFQDIQESIRTIVFLMKDRLVTWQSGYAKIIVTTKTRLKKKHYYCHLRLCFAASEVWCFYLFLL